MNFKEFFKGDGPSGWLLPYGDIVAVPFQQHAQAILDDPEKFELDIEEIKNDLGENEGLRDRVMMDAAQAWNVRFSVMGDTLTLYGIRPAVKKNIGNIDEMVSHINAGRKQKIENVWLHVPKHGPSMMSLNDFKLGEF